MMTNLHSEALHERFGTCFIKNVLNIRTACQNNSKNNINILIIISGYMNKGWLIFLRKENLYQCFVGNVL